MRRSALLRVLAVLLLLPAAAFVVFGDALRRGEEALIQRRYAEAVGHLQAALDEETADKRDRVLLLLGRAHSLAGQHEAAVAAYARLIDEHAQSPLFYKARFAQAEVYAGAGRYREAAVLYREEVARLTGPERKEEIAATYLGLAEKALARDKPDHARAVTFFDLALDLGLSEAKARRVRLHAAQARLAQGDAKDAIARFTPLVTELAPTEGRFVAMLGLGRARLSAGDPVGARRVLRDLLATAGDVPQAGDAAFEIARTYGVPKPAKTELDRAVAALEFLREKFPTHPKAKIAYFLEAQGYRNLGQTTEALRALRAFLAAQEDSALPEIATARAMIGDVLHAQGDLEPAMAAWRSYLQAHPAHAEWERVQRAIVDAEFERAMLAYEAGKPKFDQARERFEEFARQHPLDARNPQILLLFGEMFYVEKDFSQARAAYGRCVSKYPGKEASSRAQFRIGEIYENETFNYLDALRAYGKVTWGRWAKIARQRIARLERKSLGLLTERTFRSGEPAVIKVKSRNIPKVRVRVFRLALETYFRATHTAGEVEKLDIEVIEADRVFDSEVSDYQKYRETERELDIGASEPGAYVVKVDDRELEATTLVLVTDIALIAKTSRHEFFVFTQNMKENRVESGVTVVLSDGKKTIAEGTTDEKGVWRHKCDELRNLDELRVFAFNGAGSGASSLSLSGLGYSPGLTAKGYLYTDRPAYQPGQLVHVKGVVREVRDGLYQLPAANGYRLQISAPSGRLILQRAIKFSEFGSFTVDCAVPAEGELGDWSIRVEREPFGGEAFQGKFVVARYERPRLQLVAEVEEPVVYRGEPITGTLRLSYFFGEPAIDKPVVCTMQLPDGAIAEVRGRTNAAGEVPFTFETGEFAEEAAARISATVVEENVRTDLVVPVVTTEFTPQVETVRTVFLVGEPFDVDVTLRDRSGKPVAREGTVRLLRRETRGVGRQARNVEVEVATSTFTTEAKTGSARLQFTATDGGEHLLRVTAVDRFKTAVSSERELEISGDDDKVKLRLLSDRQQFEVGEKVRVKVANRAGPRLVLRTTQGDGILAHESVMLPAGESTIEFELQPWHAPNFALALAMIDGDALRVAERAFLVERDLRVTVEPQRDKAGPGETVAVAIEARDPQGRPVQAEIALAMVDDALLALHPDATPAIGAFFYGTRRETAFRTVSSCTWSYRGVSRRVSAELVAEEDRARAVIEAEKAEEPEVTGSDDFFLGGELQDKDVAASSRESLARHERPGADTLQLGQEWNQAIGLGGGAGGKFGGRFGGRRQVADQQLRAFGLYRGPSDVAPPTFFAAYAQLALPTDRPRRDFSETGGWVSAAETGADGKATIEVTLPDSTTAWRLIARGVTRDTWVGQGQATLRAAKDLQAALLAPVSLVEGDRAEITSRIHNLSSTARSVDVALKVEGGAQPQRSARTVDVDARREAEFAFALAAATAGELAFELGAKAGDLTDRVVRRVPVRPFGVEVRVGRSGKTGEADLARLSLPAGREYSHLAMSVDLGPDAGRDLVGAALGLGYRPSHCIRVEQTNLAVASRGLAALTVLDYLERIGRSRPADTEQLTGVAAACVARLAAVQEKRGGFGWIGNAHLDVRTTSQVVRFLGAAKRRGLAEAATPAERATEWLLQQLRATRGPARVRAAHALASVGRSSFEVLNTLQRSRANLGLDELARLALAWQIERRAGLATEILSALRGKLKLPATADAGEVEAIALAAQALLQASPTDGDGRRAIDWLAGKRIGTSWGTPTATAAALQALVVAGGTERAASSAAEIEVLVNGRTLATVPKTWKAASAHFDVPADWLRARDNEVRVQVAGRATVHYNVVLSGFAPDAAAIETRRRLMHVLDRHYEPAFVRHAGKDLKPGFGIVRGRYTTFRNKLTKLAAGDSGRVTVRFNVRDAFRKSMTPLVIEEPIPAGCSVPRQSISGNYDHLVVEPDRMTFYYRDGRYADTITYELQGRFQGNFRALPTRLYSALRPDLLAHGEATALRILARGSEDRDAYRLTPDELYALGKARFDTGDLAGAGENLGQLLDEWQRDESYLRENVLKDVTRMMLFVSIAKADSKATVRFFEELKDRSPELVIPFDKIVAVGRAYLDLGEFERAVMVFRGTADASFLKEAAVATTLQQMGEMRASISFLRDLLLAYPDLNTIRASLYSIGQKLAEVAAAIPLGAPVDPKVGRREDLQRLAVAVFRQFLLLYPDDPLAEEVSFAWATTQVEAGDLKAALAVAQAALQRYPKSSFEDELLYTIGYVQFALGQHDDAFRTLERVATETFATRKGGQGPSENRNHAVYLQGQIHHALGQPAKALEAYAKVEELFSDAGEASDYFLRKRLSLPEVTTFPLADPVTLAVSYRNVPKIEVKVYRVDLMRLYLLEKSLNDIRGIQLHGIRPYAEKTVELGDGRDYRTKEHKVDLALADAGAYLVVARGGSLLATGMVLRSDLKIEAQEQLDVGRIRVNVKRGDGFLGKAHVKIVGSGDQQFRSGDTDLRGIFVGDALIGRATVIIKHDDQYAFFRGSGIHQPSLYQPAPIPEAAQQLEGAKQPKKNYKGQPFQGWENNLRFNADNRSRQLKWLEKEVMNKQQRGVEVYRTK